jgi:hypothetical protein
MVQICTFHRFGLKTLGHSSISPLCHFLSCERQYHSPIWHWYFQRISLFISQFYSSFRYILRHISAMYLFMAMIYFDMDPPCIFFRDHDICILYILHGSIMYLIWWPFFSILEHGYDHFRKRVIWYLGLCCKYFPDSKFSELHLVPLSKLLHNIIMYFGHQFPFSPHTLGGIYCSIFWHFNVFDALIWPLYPLYTPFDDFDHSIDYLNCFLGNPYALPTHKRSIHTHLYLQKGAYA